MMKHFILGLLATSALLFFGFSVLFIRNVLTPSGPVFVKAQGRFVQGPIVKNEKGLVTIQWKTQKQYERNTIHYQHGSFRPKELIDRGVGANSEQDLSTGVFTHTVTLTSRQYRENAAFVQHGDYFFQAESSNDMGKDQSISEVIHFKID